MAPQRLTVRLRIKAEYDSSNRRRRERERERERESWVPPCPGLPWLARPPGGGARAGDTGWALDQGVHGLSGSVPARARIALVQAAGGEQVAPRELPFAGQRAIGRIWTQRAGQQIPRVC
jgi:hypothetical protein